MKKFILFSFNAKTKSCELHKGQILIELLVAVGMSAILIPAIFTGIFSSREGGVQQSQRLKAVALAEESLEAIRIVREENWENVEVNGIYHPVVSGNTWVLSSGSENVGIFTRSLTISDMYRDISGNLSQTPGILDPSVKKVVSNVSWGELSPSSISSTTYLTRLTNEEYIETLVADFEAGFHDGTGVTNLIDGEVQLGGGGAGDWCDPELTIAALDLPRNGEALALTAIEGKAFVGTGANASGVSYAEIDISNSSPPVATSPSENWFNGYKTNGVFGEQNYAYLATDTNSEEIVIVDTTTNPYTKIGWFDSPGQTDANSIFVYGNVGYMTSSNTLYTFDLSSKTGSRPQLGSVGLSGVGNRMYINGTYAYIAISGGSQELQIIDVSTPSVPVVVGSSSVGGPGGVDVYVNEPGTRAYLAVSAAPAKDEVYIIDTIEKTGSRPVVGSYDTNGMNPKGIRVVPGNRVIVVGHNGMEYQVISIVDEANPTQCGGLEVDSGINALWSVTESDGEAFSYILTQDANAEFKIIEGGPGGGFSVVGTYTSAVYDVGKQTAFNRFLATFDEPFDTTLQFQVGLGDTVDGVCDENILTYIGPDGTSGTFYDTGGLIPFDDDGFAFENPAQCFAYKAYFDAPSGTPVLYDFTLNYSP